MTYQYGTPPPWGYGPPPVFIPTPSYPSSSVNDPLQSINNTIAFYKAMRKDMLDEHKEKGDKKKESPWSRVDTFIILGLTMPFLYALQFILIWNMLHP